MKYLRAAVFMLLTSLLTRQAAWSQQANDTTHIRRVESLPVRSVSNAPANVAGHSDTAANDTVKPKLFEPNPKKAGMYSAILPGMGQFYNRQYWKIPMVYGGAAIAAYFIINNLDNYQSYRKAYIGRINNPYPSDQYVNIYSEAQLNQLQNDYNKYLDLSVLFTGIGFALQVVDAITSAHLKNFDVSRDISFKMRPVVYPSAVGLGLVMDFK